MLAKSQASKDGEIIAFSFFVIGIRVLGFVLFCFVVLLRCASLLCVEDFEKMVRGEYSKQEKAKNSPIRRNILLLHLHALN